MKPSRRRLLGGAVVALVLAGVASAGLLRSGQQGVGVRMEEVERRDLVATVTASGHVRARRRADVSADVTGRVTEVAVEEGERVEAGDPLLALDASRYRSAVARSRATLSQAEARAAQQRATVRRVEREYERTRTLWSRDSTLVSRRELEDAASDLEVEQARLSAAEHEVEQARAALEEAEDDLARTSIRAPIGGIVTRMNIREGETAVVGTTNNPGSLLVTVSDLATVEAVVEVDETEIPEISLGDSAVVEIDALPGRSFGGEVVKIGNSAVRPPRSTATGDEGGGAVSFEVVVALDDPPVQLRPDLSATAEVVTAVRESALAVPIIALTVREPDSGSGPADGPGEPGHPGSSSDGRGAAPDVEGVFVVRDGRAVFTPVRVGIAGREHFEVISGLSGAELVVSGPYRSIRELADGDPVRRIDDGAGGAE